jgi:uncharacterized protein (TIGR03435 family)
VNLGIVIYQAYFDLAMAGKDAVVGAPDWVGKDTWDIEAKLAPEDMGRYERERTTGNFATPAARQMLQNMLAERCKLVVHRVPAHIPAFAVELGKKGPRLTQAPPNEAQPSGSIAAPGGGFIVPYKRGEEKPHVDFHAVSMSAFAQHLRGIAGGPVIDRTGLTGKYDFRLSWVGLDPDELEGVVSSDDPYPLSHWNFGALGLRVEPIQIPSEHIVIDHIEKPSEN